MSVFTALGEEHALLLRLVGRLERGTADPDERAAARETRNILLVLLKGLEAHERLEHLVFDSVASPSAAALAALALVEGQHALLAALREEAGELLRNVSSGESAPLRPFVLRLARLLRRHFEAEERELWPSFNALATRSTLSRLDRQAHAQVRAMEGEIDRYWAQVADYLTGDR